MKTIRFLKTLTIVELYLNLILAIAFNVSFFTNHHHITLTIFTIIAFLHISSMVLHWIAWKQLVTTHKQRIFFNAWVIGTFLSVFLASYINSGLLVLILCFLFYFAFAWFFSYCYILFKEYQFLKKKLELYEQRELIHF